MLAALLTGATAVYQGKHAELYPFLLQNLQLFLALCVCAWWGAAECKMWGGDLIVAATNRSVTQQQSSSLPWTCPGRSNKRGNGAQPVHLLLVKV